MCGIAGIVSFGAPVAPGVLAEMNARLVHRGPDDGGEWVSPDGRVGLANRRLAILDLSPAGHMPMASADKRYWIAYNGEIYNYIELRAELQARGRQFRTESDTEVILAAFAEWGDRCVEKLNGMFAFAIWDCERQELFGARDRFGEKPFYYARVGERWLFASEIKALLADPGVPRRLDDVTAARYLMLALVDVDDRTFFADIKHVPAAHSVKVSRDGAVTFQRYWHLDLTRDDGPATLEQAADGFRELFTDAINIRLRSDVAVGSSLSGGLDSSSIVCTMRSLLAGHPTATQNTFSARYRTGKTDEGRFIDAVVAKAGIPAADAHNVYIEPADLVADLDQFVWHQDEPVAHTSQFAQWKVMKLARDCGVTVLLDGQGADEIIGGYPSPTFGQRYAELLTEGRWLELGRELGAFGRHQGAAGIAMRYVAGALVPDALRRAVRSRFHGTTDLTIGAAMPESPSTLAPGDGPRLRRALYQILTVSSLPGLLRYGDRNSMAFSREARLPFLDHRLVEYAYALKPEHLVQNGTTKIVLRRAMSGVIPDAVRDRMDKIGFATPERDWLLGSLRPRMESALDAARRRGIVPAAAIDKHWNALVSGEGRSGNAWRIANLELWMQMYIDPKTKVAAA